MAEFVTPRQIKATRDALGLTQAQFAEALGITREYVGKLESGKAEPSKALSLAIEHLLCKRER